MTTSTRDLSKEDLEILIDNHIEIDEQLVDTRKGVAQTRYILSVKDTYYCYEDYCEKPTPEHLKGFWMQCHATDNRYEDVIDCLKDGDEFVKCYEKKIETYVWEKL